MTEEAKQREVCVTQFSSDDGDMPEARNDDDDDISDGEANMTDDIPNNTRGIFEGVATDLRRGNLRQEVQEPHSPLKKRDTRSLKRKEVPVPKGAERNNKKSKENEVQIKRNSDMFPAEVRPEI